MTKPTPAHPYRVRKQSSGYTTSEKWIVVKMPGSRRVSTEAHYYREAAQMAADDLNIMTMVKSHAEDPRPYEVRFAEADAQYRESVAR